MKSFSEIVEKMQTHGMKVPKQPYHFQIPNAKAWLQEGLTHFLGFQKKRMIWLKEYDEIAEWLTDNKGKGLFLYGSVGQGKTLISRYVIPAILLGVCERCVRSYDTAEMNEKIEEIKRSRLVSLDDIGTDSTLNDFGTKRELFAEVIDNAEKTSQLLIITTNLNKEQLIERYGSRVFDRIIATTKRVLFTGESLRK